MRLLNHLLTLCAFAALAACGNPPYPRGDVNTLFPGADKPVATTDTLGARPIFSMRMPGQSGQPMLLFIHGSPGDWKAWVHFLATPQLAGLGPRVAVDRPGFAGSSGPVIPDLRAQAALLAQLIPVGQKAILVGHSLGGPIAAWMALDAPDKVCGVVSVAGSLASSLEQPRWYNEVANWQLVRWLLPQEMVLSNQEMMPLSKELAKLEAAMPALHVPFILIQGAKDELVMPATADEVAQRMPARWLTVIKRPQDGHFVLWQSPDVVTDAIRQLPCAEGLHVPH
jgi:pimeloyl-ACP methyl ester carboxylesterase